jgi:hypothetical protein
MKQSRFTDEQITWLLMALAEDALIFLSTHQPPLPASPLNGPDKSGVIHPP